MAYIVKSSLDIGGKIVPWNEQETQKLIKEKEEYLKEKEIKKSKYKEIKEVKEKEEIEINEENKEDFKTKGK